MSMKQHEVVKMENLKLEVSCKKKGSHCIVLLKMIVNIQHFQAEMVIWLKEELWLG